MNNNVYYMRWVSRLLICIFMAIMALIGLAKSISLLGTIYWRDILILYLPGSILATYFLVYFLLFRIELKPDEIVRRALIVKRIKWEEITKIQLTKLTQCIISSNKTKIEITSNISNYDKIICTVLSRARCNPDVKIVGPQDLMDKYRNID
ncbi:MAG: hypothetical protein ACTSQ8_25910 [Candidatus Helarchaeota archaeon]